MRVTRVNAALIVAIVPLVTMLLWDIARGRPAPVDQVEWAGIAPLEVDRLRLVNGSEVIEARRVGVRWSLHSPVEEPADPRMVQEVLRSFADPIRPDVRVAEVSTDPEPYGFVDGERIELELYVGQQRVLGLELGRPLARGSSFVREIGDEAVYRARVPGRYRLERPASAWRDHRVTGLDKGKVVRLTVEDGEETWHYERRTEDWACLERPEMMLDARLVEGMARTFASLRAVERVDDPPQDAFEEVVLKIEGLEHEKGSRTVEFGGIAGDDGARWVRSGERVFTVAGAHLITLRRTPEELRDRDVVKLDWREVERVTVTLGDRRFVAVPRGEHVWGLVEPQGYSIDSREMGFSLDAMVELRAFGIAGDIALGDSGVDDPGALSIHIERVEAPPIDVRVGPLRGSVHHVVREDREIVYTLRVSSARSLIQGFGLRWEP